MYLHHLRRKKWQNALHHFGKELIRSEPIDRFLLNNHGKETGFRMENPHRNRIIRLKAMMSQTDKQTHRHQRQSYNTSFFV